MPEKKICQLPQIRCDELLHARATLAAKMLGVSITSFLFSAVVEKSARMESEWKALDSIFGKAGSNFNESLAPQQKASGYVLFDEDMLG